MLNLYNFHLVELVDPVQAPDILSVGSCLTPETGSIGSIFYGKIIRIQDHISVDIGNRYLCSWNQVEVVVVTWYICPSLSGS